MKKMVWLMTALLAAQVVAQAQTQVLSRNAVGYVKLTAPRDQLVLGRCDFESLDGGGGIRVSNLFGEQVPPFTRVVLWDRASAMYITCVKGARAGAWTGGSNVVRRGDGFWIQIPSSAPSNAYDIFLMGEVPDRLSAPTTTIAGIVGVNLLGYPYPVSVLWTNTALAGLAALYARLYIWNGSNYETYIKTPRGWGAASNLVLSPGQGFWLGNTNMLTWVEAKPYTWP